MLFDEVLLTLKAKFYSCLEVTALEYGNKPFRSILHHLPTAQNITTGVSCSPSSISPFIHETGTISVTTYLSL